MYQRASISSGGGGGSAVAGIAETTVNYGQNQQFSIDTGLTEIKKFYGVFRISGNNRCNLIQYDADYIGASKYNVQQLLDGSTSFGSSYTRRDFTTTTPNNTYMVQLEGISGGTITFRVSNASTNYPITSMYWFAE